MGVDKNYRTEVQPEVVYLNRLIQAVTNGRLRVPLFQRQFVWSIQDMLDLMDSVYRGYPIGSILVWDTEAELASSDHLGPIFIGSCPPGVVGYLLDGQQRVSTLVGTLQLPEATDSLRSGVDWRLYFDLEEQHFCTAPREGLDPKLFPVRKLLATGSFFEACRAISTTVPQAAAERLLRAADALANAFRNYQLPMIRVSEAQLVTAVTVFTRMNRKGRKMSADELVSALTYKEGQFHLAQRLDELEQELAHRGFQNLNRVFLLRSVLASLDLDIYATDWANLMVKEEVRLRLPNAFDDAAKAIHAALDFLRTLGVTSDRLLPYGLQLVLLGEFFRHCPSPTPDVSALLEQWFWVTSFTGWFGGMNSSQARLALRDIRRMARGEGTDVSLDLRTPALPFPSRFDGRSARVRAFLLFLGSLEPAWQDGRKLDTGELLCELGPQSLAYVVTSPMNNVTLHSSPANRMFVARDYRGMAFSVLLETWADDLGFLASHGFPPDSVDLVKRSERELLIENRLQALIAGERRFMQKRGVTIPTESTRPPLADSDASNPE